MADWVQLDPVMVTMECDCCGYDRIEATVTKCQTCDHFICNICLEYALWVECNKCGAGFCWQCFDNLTSALDGDELPIIVCKWCYTNKNNVEGLIIRDL